MHTGLAPPVTPHTSNPASQFPQFAEWLSALEARHLADLRIPEVTRALRALSSAYVERRDAVARGATLDSAGKRAAFALFYAPLHFLTTAHVVQALGAADEPPARILDIGCGTGAAGAAWALAAGGAPAITGIDRHPWTVGEATWTYRQLGLHGRAKQGDATRLPTLRQGTAVVAAYLLNELTAEGRARVETALFAAAAEGTRVLVLEPIARGVAPWWDTTAARVRALGGRADEWRFDVELPPMLRLFDKAAGLHHDELTVRTLYISRAILPGL
ncbi:MAG: methyltransferase domain-containing protein [Vicinamibacterales bacterium]